MPTASMGRAVTEARVENLKNLWDAQSGMILVENARSVEVKDALAESDAA